MADALDELADLSEVLQIRQLTHPRAGKAIRTTIRVISLMIENPGPKLSEAMQAIDIGQF